MKSMSCDNTHASSPSTCSSLCSYILLLPTFVHPIAGKADAWYLTKFGPEVRYPDVSTSAGLACTPQEYQDICSMLHPLTDPRADGKCCPNHASGFCGPCDSNPPVRGRVETQIGQRYQHLDVAVEQNWLAIGEGSHWEFVVVIKRRDGTTPAQMTSVVVPPGKKAGQLMQVHALDGQLLPVVVPQGLTPGQSFQVSAMPPAICGVVQGQTIASPVVNGIVQGQVIAPPALGGVVQGHVITRA